MEGIGLFTYETLKRITTSHPDIDFYFLFDRKYDAEFLFSGNVKPVVLFPPARHPFLWLWWFEVSVAGWLNKYKPDLFLSTDGYGCLFTEVKQVIVIHDIAFEHFPQLIPFITELYCKFFTPCFVRKANRVVTVSEFSKADIVKHYNISEEKIDVVYNGAKKVYKPAGDEAKRGIRAKYSEGRNFFVCVSSIHPRKNIKNLLLAFDLFKKETNSDFKLLIVGRKAWKFSDIDDTFEKMSFKNDVKFLGHVPPHSLGEIVAGSFASVYVSYFEGFGIPIIEAMNCDVPVITSNVTSMPEVAGDAALLVNPGSVHEIAEAMTALYQNYDLVASLIEKGEIRRKNFSWDLTSDKLWNSCLKAMGK